MAKDSYNPNTSFMCYFVMVIQLFKKAGKLIIQEKNHNTVLNFCQELANL